MKTRKVFQKRILPVALALSFVFLASHTARAADVDSEEDVSDDAFTDTLSLDADGNAALNGKELKDKTSASLLYTEVEKVLPNTDGNTVLYLQPVEMRTKNADGRVEVKKVKGEAKPFAFSTLWKMYDAEGSQTDDPQLAVHVLMPSPVDVDTFAFDVKWNECDKDLSGNYVGLKCNGNRFMSDEYVAYLKQHFLPCVNEGLAAIGAKPAVAVHILHDGTSPDGKHDRNSLHAAGRAVDVQILSTVGEDGTKRDFDFRKTNTDHKVSPDCKPAGDNCKFYTGFRACWHKLQVARSCPRRQGGAPIGTLGWEDHKHVAHHLHTSMPFCPKSKGFKITDSVE